MCAGRKSRGKQKAVVKSQNSEGKTSVDIKDQVHNFAIVDVWKYRFGRDRVIENDER